VVALSQNFNLCVEAVEGVVLAVSHLATCFNFQYLDGHLLLGAQINSEFDFGVPTMANCFQQNEPVVQYFTHYGLAVLFAVA